MPVRVAAIEVNHWHSLYDAAYLRLLSQMPDVQIVALQDSQPEIVAKRAAEVGNPPTFTDYKQMLAEIKPDFVVALGRHNTMAEIAHYLLDHNVPFFMEKPMGFNAEQVRGIAEKVKEKKAYVAVPLSQRYTPFVQQAQKMLKEGSFGPLSHFYMRMNRPTSARYPAWDSPWMLDPAISNGGCLRNLGAHGLDVFLLLTGEEARVTGAQLSWRALRQPVEDYASVLLQSTSGVLGTLEVGNTFPRDGTDGEWKLSGRDALLTVKDGVMRINTARGEETIPIDTTENYYYMIVRDILERWQRGEAPPASVQDCYRAVQLIDQAYAVAGNPYA